MNEIDRLKHEEKELMDKELYAEDYVQTLKVEESEIDELETEERPNYAPQRWRERRVERKRSGWFPFLGIIAVIWVLSAGVVNIGSLWAVLLLFPAFKNWERVQEDRRTGNVTRQTKKALRGMMFAFLFAFMFLFNAWSAFFPLLLISWGLTSIYAGRWKNDPVYY